MKKFIILIGISFLFIGCSQKRNVKNNMYSSDYTYEVKSISKEESRRKVEKSIEEFKKYLHDYFAGFNKKELNSEKKSTYLSRYNSLTKDKK